MNKIIIGKSIKENRPNIGDSSVNTYCSILNSLYRSLFKDGDFDLKNFNKTEEILEHIKNKNLASKKTILSALFVLTEKPEYQRAMIDEATEYNNLQKEQQMTDKQKENWVTQDQIKTVFDKYITMSDYLVKEMKNRELTSKEFQTWQDFIMLCLSSGIFIEPQRVKDWVCFKVKNIDAKTDNYMTGKGNKCQLVFNAYKTAKYHGQKVMSCPPELCKILNTFINHVKKHSDHLLNDSNWKPLSQVTFTQRLNKIFGKNVSVNILRHSYLSQRFADGKMTLKELNETAKNMGHSVMQSMEYIKTDAPTNETSKSDNIELAIEEKPDDEKPAVEEPAKKRRGRPKKVIE